MARKSDLVRFGRFKIADMCDLEGELCLDGARSYLYLRCDDPIVISDWPDRAATGTLHDLTKVSLFECIWREQFGSVSKGNEQYYYSRLFPHYVLTGSYHVRPDDKCVQSVDFTFSDAEALFYDLDSFGSADNPSDVLSYIWQRGSPSSARRPGPMPYVGYFSGHSLIGEYPTQIGLVSAWHCPTWTLPGPRGLSLSNKIFVKIEPEGRWTALDAIQRADELLHFFEILLGRAQTPERMRVHIASDGNTDPLEVHWSYLPGKSAGDADENPKGAHPADVLIWPIDHPDEMKAVIRGWFESSSEHADARGRFRRCFSKKQMYDIDRLVAAANMFDLLPDSVMPNRRSLSKPLIDARDSLKAELKGKLPSAEWEELSKVLGWLGRLSLKEKVVHRARKVTETVGDRFPQLEMVLAWAVKLRNHYVHGSDIRAAIRTDMEVVAFLTDSLEFVFGAAELVDVGWNIRRYIQQGGAVRHPFGLYIANYGLNVRHLEEVLLA